MKNLECLGEILEEKELEIEWRAMTPQTESLEVFPEAREYLLDRLNRWEKYLVSMRRIVRNQMDWACLHKDEFNKWFWAEVIKIDDGNLLNLVAKEIRKMEILLTPDEKSSEITDADIQRARDYPIKDLIGTDKDFVLCPNHTEKHPSFCLKKNFGYCFSCGYSCDTIKYLQDAQGLSFVEAVKRLR